MVKVVSSPLWSFGGGSGIDGGLLKRDWAGDEGALLGNHKEIHFDTAGDVTVDECR